MSDCPDSSAVPTCMSLFQAFSTFTEPGTASGVVLPLSLQFPFGDHVTFLAVARVCVCVRVCVCMREIEEREKESGGVLQMFWYNYAGYLQLIFCKEGYP